MIGALLLASGSLAAKVSVTRYAIKIDEPLTEATADAALAEFKQKGGTTYSLDLSNCTDAGLSLAVQKFSAMRRITIRKSPALTSIAPLKSAKVDYVDLKELPKVTDVSPVGEITGLQGLLIEKVGFKNPDLTFCAKLSKLRSFELGYSPATFKSISGIDKCTQLNSLVIRYNGSVIDLSCLANFKRLRKLDLRYVSKLDLTPVAQMPELTDLNLYGSTDLDLAPLANCKKLRYIMIYATKRIKDYKDLGKIKTLENVNAGLSQMNDLSWAPQLPNLKRLSLFAEQYVSYAPLANCKKLEDLTFWSMKGVVDIAQFADGGAPLKRLSFSGSTIANEAKLASLGKTGTLIQLRLDNIARGKQVVDLSFLTALPTLKELNLEKTAVKNFGNIAGCKQISSLNVRNTRGIDLDIIAKLPDLSTVYLAKDQQTPFKQKTGGKKIRIY